MKTKSNLQTNIPAQNEKEMMAPQQRGRIDPGYYTIGRKPINPPYMPITNPPRQFPPSLVPPRNRIIPPYLRQPFPKLPDNFLDLIKNNKDKYDKKQFVPSNLGQLPQEEMQQPMLEEQPNQIENKFNSIKNLLKK
jgi:hypothetical protein